MYDVKLTHRTTIFVFKIQVLLLNQEYAQIKSFDRSVVELELMDVRALD